MTRKAAKRRAREVSARIPQPSPSTLPLRRRQAAAAGGIDGICWLNERRNYVIVAGCTTRSSWAHGSLARRARCALRSTATACC